MVSAIKIRMDLCFDASNNVVLVEDIIEMHNVDNTQNKSGIYNESICCHNISRDLKILLGNLNGVNNSFTWMKCCTRGCHNMAEAGIVEISNGETVKNGMPCLELNKNSSFDKR